MPSTLQFRTALRDSTNSNPNPDGRPKLPKTKHSRFPLPRSRKSPPTLTISLESVNASCLNNGIASSSPSLNRPHQPQHLNIIPFPSSSESVSESDSLPLSNSNSNDSIMASSNRPYQVRPRTSQTETRRRRSNAWISQMGVHNAAHMKPVATKKRARRTSKRLLDDLRFLAVMRRSVEWNLAERYGCRLEPESDVGKDMDDGSRMRTLSETQDRLLVQRLRAYLLSQGYQDDGLPTTSSRTPSAELDDINMDLDAESHPSIPSDVGPIISQSDRLPLAPLPSMSTSTYIHSPPQTPPGLPNPTLSMSQLVATLMLRRQDRSTPRVRSIVRPPPAAGTGTYYHTLRSSPLACGL